MSKHFQNPDDTNALNNYIHNHILTWLWIGTPMKNGGVKLVFIGLKKRPKTVHVF